MPPRKLGQYPFQSEQIAVNGAGFFPHWDREYRRDEVLIILHQGILFFSDTSCVSLHGMCVAARHGCAARHNDK